MYKIAQFFYCKPFKASPYVCLMTPPNLCLCVCVVFHLVFLLEQLGQKLATGKYKLLLIKQYE